MPAIKKIDHVALVVADIDAALAFWRDALGLQLEHVEEVPREKSAIAFLPLGESEIELVQPTDADSGVAKYLEKRGPGMHHICLEVDDLAGMLAQLKAKGVQLIHEEPVISASGKQYVFIHPKAAFGVLVELYQLPG
ncbi:MAG: methylmalonyl-CoA epimerase [Anaerolineales bacterium]|nr:methylmalonyl-CoA epimerase [Anaerolineales bacterium]